MVTVEKKVVGKMVTVVKEVSVLVLWEDDSEIAVIEGLRSIILVCWLHMNRSKKSHIPG